MSKNALNKDQNMDLKSQNRDLRFQKQDLKSSKSTISSANLSLDTQYRDLLQKILNEGVTTPVPQGVDALTIMAPGSLHYRLAEGFPVITERDLSNFWRAPIAEILGFAHGARTQEELASFGCKWWKAWVTPEKCAKRGLPAGDLGPGSYGAAFHNFPSFEDPQGFNQFEAIITQIKSRPELRTHFITPWIPQYTARLDGRTQKVVVCPCHGWMHFRVIEDRLYLHMFQRSGDVPIGVPSNLIQYSALLLLVAHLTGLKPYEYIHTISDAHIYVDQIPAVETMLAREPRPLPQITLTPTATQKTNFWDFSKDDFELLNYHPHPAIKGIPAAI